MPDVGPLAPGARPDPPRYMKGNGGSGDVGSLLRDLHIPWPEANETLLREAAEAWHRLADALRDGCGRGDSMSRSLISNNEGAAVDAFEKYWGKYGLHGRSALPMGADACDALGNACTHYADGVAAAKRKIEEVLAEAGAAVAVGTAAAFFTFGVAEGAADGIAAAILANVGETISGLIIWVANSIEFFSAPVAAAMDTGAVAIADALGTGSAASAFGAGMVGAYNGTVTGGLQSLAEDQVRALFGDKPLSAAQVRSALITGGEAGGVGGVLGKLAALGRPQLVQLLREVGTAIGPDDLPRSMQLVELAKQIEGTTGKISASMLTKAATQLVTAQQINADKIVEGQIPTLLKRAAGKDGE